MVATSNTAPAVFIAAPRVDRRTHLHPGPNASVPGRVERPVLRLNTATEVPAQTGPMALSAIGSTDDDDIDAHRQRQPGDGDNAAATPGTRTAHHRQDGPPRRLPSGRWASVRDGLPAAGGV